MDKYILKKNVSRKRRWVTEMDDENKNLNPTRGQYLSKQSVSPVKNESDIRVYSKKSEYLT